jgi:predicted DNA-binding protein
MRLSVPSKAHTIRFPQDLYDKMQILAQESGRTFNGTVVYLSQIGYAVAIKYQESISKQIEDENVSKDEGNAVS